MSDTENSISFAAPEPAPEPYTVEPAEVVAPTPSPRSSKRPNPDKYKPFVW